MSSTEIEYDKFIKHVHSKFAEDLELNDVKNILDLEESYNKDNPSSLDKSLVLNRLVFSGEKINGEEFIYDQTFDKGINVWIADNMKGKSTVFKIVKYALTGVDSIKADVRKWIREIILEFQIEKTVYTVYIDKQGRDKGALYTFGIGKLQELRSTLKLDSIEEGKEFEFKSKTMLEEQMQNFFFGQFNYYSLKYTQKSSTKEDHRLRTANLSWKSYFKSIYLESSNYEYLFFEKEYMGNQGRKIFEMILGLPLTYPINMLGVQKDSVSSELGRLKLVDETRAKTKISEKIKLMNEYSTITKVLKKIREEGKIDFNEKPLIKEYSEIQERVNNSLKKSRVINEKYLRERHKIVALNAEIKNLKSDHKKIQSEINRLQKQILNLELYREAGSFFSNLDIKVCPHCEIEVTEERRKHEVHTHECSLCGETPTQPKANEEELKAKITKITKEKEGHQSKLDRLQIHIQKQLDNEENLNNSISELSKQIDALPSSASDTKRLKEIEASIEAINEKRKNRQKLIDQERGLIREEAVLKFRIDQAERAQTSEYSESIKKLSLKKDVLTFALGALEKKRKILNQNILTKLEDLILNEIHAFGLHSIVNIEINEKYDLLFTQNEVAVSFDALTEGEKLRVKLAFYLSLIQLDIEHKLGRHPRFLIFDSPGSEEMIPKHLHGLSEILKNVNERFRGQLQIFIGSALYDFIEITEPEKRVIKMNGENIF